MKNHIPVSILNPFSKNYQNYIKESSIPFAEKFLSKFKSTDKKNIRHKPRIGKIRRRLKTAKDNKKVVRALLGLSKVFECVPDGFFIAKMHAYGCSEDCLVFICLYLKRRKQNIKVITLDLFQTLFCGVP